MLSRGDRCSSSPPVHGRIFGCDAPKIEARTTVIPCPPHRLKPKQRRITAGAPGIRRSRVHGASFSTKAHGDAPCRNLAIKTCQRQRGVLAQRLNERSIVIVVVDPEIVAAGSLLKQGIKRQERRLVRFRSFNNNSLSLRIPDVVAHASAREGPHPRATAP